MLKPGILNKGINLKNMCQCLVESVKNSPKMAVPTKRERVTLVKVVNLCLRTPGKMMTKARKRVTKTM